MQIYSAEEEIGHLKQLQKWLCMILKYRFPLLIQVEASVGLGHALGHAANLHDRHCRSPSARDSAGGEIPRVYNIPEKDPRFFF